MFKLITRITYSLFYILYSKIITVDNCFLQLAQISVKFKVDLSLIFLKQMDVRECYTHRECRNYAYK